MYKGHADGHHIDLPIYYKIGDIPELAHTTKDWIDSDPKEFWEWFNDKVKIHGQQLRRLVRYLKAWKNYREHRNSNLKLPSGFILTILAHDYYEPHERDDISFKNTIEAIKDSLNITFECYRPTTPSDEDLLEVESFSETRKKDFLNELDKLHEACVNADEATNFKKATEFIREKFGERFPLGKDEEEKKEANKLKGLIPPSSPKPYFSSHKKESNLSNLNCSLQEINEVLLKYPNLIHEENLLFGTLDIYENGFEDSFEIQMDLTPFPNQFPVVREVGERVPQIADRHIYPDGSCCLTTPAQENIWLKTKISNLLEFVDKVVVPFFLNQRYYELTGKYLREYQHGTTGIYETYIDILGIQNIELIFKLLYLRIRGSKIRPNDNCYCGSGQKLKNCHSEHYKDFRKISLSTIKYDLFQFYKALKDLSNNSRFSN